jgi:hypothetical protein
MQQTQTLGEHASPTARFTKLREWLLRDQAIAVAQREQLLPRQKSEVQAARRAVLVGKTLLDSSAETSDTSFAVLSLCREAAYWALRALRTEEVDGNIGLAELYASLPSEKVLKLAGSEASLALIVEVLVGQTFVETAELDEARAHAAALASQHFVEQLLALAELPDTKLQKVRTQRWIRPFLGVLSVVVVIYSLVAVVRSFGRPRNLAEGKNWRVSSVYPGLNFAASGKIGGPKAFDDLLFHTNSENNPWAEFDLGDSVKVQSVYVRNRKSCCTENAVPLVVELSDNQKDWAEVAQRAEVFAEWTATFSSRKARYVRLRVARMSALHLDTVAIY